MGVAVRLRQLLLLAAQILPTCAACSPGPLNVLPHEQRTSWLLFNTPFSHLDLAPGAHRSRVSTPNYCRGEFSGLAVHSGRWTALHQPYDFLHAKLYP